MAVANGFGKVVTSGSVFMYDTGDTVNSYIGEPTTNIFRHYGTTGQGSAADNAVNFEIQGTTGFIRLGYGQTFGGYTIQPNDVVYKYDLGGYGCHYHGNDVSIPSGRSVTFTFDFYVSPGAGSYPITNFLANIETGTGAGMSVGAPNSLTGVWQTVSVTTGPTTSAGNLRMLLYPGACGGALASNGYVLYKNPQVELLPHKTPFTQTSRSVTQGLLPIVGNSTIDLSNMSYDSNAQMYFDGTDDYIDTTKNASDLGIYDAPYTMESVFKITNTISGDNMVFGTNQTNYRQGLHNGVRNGVIYFAHYIADYAAGSVALNEIVHIAWVYDGTTAFIYKNGILQGSASIASFIGTTNIQIGKSWAYFQGGEIPIAKIYNRALSAAEVKQNYNKYKTRFNLP